MLHWGYTIGTQTVKVCQVYEAGIGGGWLDKCSPVHCIAGIRSIEERETESCVSAVSFTVKL